MTLNAKALELATKAKMHEKALKRFASCITGVWLIALTVRPAALRLPRPSWSDWSSKGFASWFTGVWLTFVVMNSGAGMVALLVHPGEA